MKQERGSLINNRYRIVEILGQGGMGSVYRAIDENLGVEVAVKDNLITTEEYARQFHREATILANLRHPNLPRVTDHFVISDQGQFLVMDYIEGEDLRQRIERIGPLPPEEVVTIGAAVCEALTYLASRKPPIIHRDIKPGNIKITPQGQIYLVDFGLAKIFKDSQITSTGARAMTPGYSPPEQYGTARTDERTDIFSLGATLYAVLTGSPPEDALARMLDQVELTQIRKRKASVPSELAACIEKSIEVRPEDRYQTADEFKQALLNAGVGGSHRNGELIVPPPPDGGKLVSKEFPQKAEKWTGEAVNGISDQQQPTSAPMEEVSQPESRLMHRATKRVGGWLVLLFTAVLLTGVSAWMYLYEPGFVTQVVSQWQTLIFPLDELSSATPRFISSPTLTKASLFTSPTIVSISTDTPGPAASTVPTDSPTATFTHTPIPTPHGGAAQIAFASNSTGVPQIYVINVDGTGRRQVTDIQEGACQPSWSPDGKRIAFVSPCNGNVDYYPVSAIYIINVDGSGLLPLPTLAGGDYDPDWSPDGKQIVFTSLRNGLRPQLFTIDLDTYQVVHLSEEYSTDSQPSWSPDGEMIAFVSSRQGRQQEIWVMDADGSRQIQFSQSPQYLNFKPSWSPDGENLIFTQFVKLGSVPWVSISPFTFLEPYVEYRIGQGAIPMREAKYSPDSLWIVFEGWTGDTGHDIYIISASGSGRQRITTDPKMDFDPTWEPILGSDQ